MLNWLQDAWDDLTMRLGRHLGMLVLAALVAAAVLAVAAVPRSAFGDAIGLTVVQQRLRATGSAAWWSAKAMMQRDESAKPLIVFGSLDRLDDKSNQLLVDLPLGDKWEKRAYQVADLIVTDPVAAQAYFAALPTRSARLEVFHGTHVVGFVQGEPINIGLLEAGAAIANPEPPSNMVSRALATYYWSVARGVTPSVTEE